MVNISFDYQGGDLILPDNQFINSLPDNLHVTGNLMLSNCSIKKLPHNLRVSGGMTITGCQYLQEIPDDIRVVGTLWMNECKLIKSIPWIASQKIIAIGCDSLVSLPNNMMLDHLDLERCGAISSLPNDIKVRSLLDLRNCISLLHLPDDIGGARSLYLQGCVSLQSLPKKLRVNDLNISRCVSLKSLPVNLVVQELELGGCAALFGDIPGCIYDNVYFSEGQITAGLHDEDRVQWCAENFIELKVKNFADYKPFPVKCYVIEDAAQLAHFMLKWG